MTRTRLFILLGVLTVVRFLCGAFMELTPDEAYYYQWSLRPDWGYFSAGPGVTMAMLASTQVLGATELGVRFFSPLLGLGTSLLVFALGRRIYDERTGIWAAVVLQCLPVFNVGSVLMTTSALSVFFWALTVWSLWRALEKTPQSLNWWLLTGAATGVGALCDYVNLVTLIPMLAVLVVVRPWRGEWRKPGVYLALAVVAVCLVPVWWWNRGHGWIALAQPGKDGPWNTGNLVNPDQPFIFVARLVMSFSPLLFLGLWVSFCGGLVNYLNHRKTAFLMSFCVPLIVWSLFGSLQNAGQPMVILPAVLSLVVFLTHDWLRRQDRRPGFRWVAKVAIGLGVIISLLVLDTAHLRSLGIRGLYGIDGFRAARGWRATALVVSQMRMESEKKAGESLFLIANDYAMASEIAWFLPNAPVVRAGDPPVYLPESQMILSQYSYWPGYDTFDTADTHELDPFNTEEGGVNRFMGKDALFITDEQDDKPVEAVVRGFAKWEYLGEREIKEYGITVRKIRFFICHNYKTLPL